MLELFTTILHVFEEIETCTTWTEQHTVAIVSHAIAGSNAVFHTLHIGNRDSERVEVIVQLLVVDT